MLLLTRRINECVIIHRSEIAERIKANLEPVKKKAPVITYRQRFVPEALRVAGGL